MILFPAIDLKDGRCVRLLRGEMAQETVFNLDPADQARQFQAQGFEYLHLVDLNGAVDGKPVNQAAVRAILDSVEMPVQLGGGIREEATAEAWLEAGIARVIIGTLALREPQRVKALCQKHPGRIAIGIDARAGQVAVEGWVEQSDVSAIELAKMFEDAGAAAIIYTDIERDGAMGGVNVTETTRLAEALSTPIIASGGVASLQDLAALKAAAQKLASTGGSGRGGIAGAISGRALYDGALDPAQALALLAA